MISALSAILVGSSLAYGGGEWGIEEHVTEWELRMQKVPGGVVKVKVPPTLEYHLCSTRSVEEATATYIRIDGQKDYVKLVKLDADVAAFEENPVKGAPVSCFVIDHKLVEVDGTFSVSGFYPARNPYVEPEDIKVFPIFTKNGFVSMKPIPDSVNTEPNHYYSTTPPSMECQRPAKDEGMLLHYEDRNPETMKAYAVRMSGYKRERPALLLEQIGYSPQSAVFYVPPSYIRDIDMKYYALDQENNYSQELELKDIPACQ